MEYLLDLLHQIFGQDLHAAGLIVINLIIIESLLSVDNAAVLATMVIDLPEHQRGKALRYGIIGAYVFRGICLLLASWIMHISWLKMVGGIYLLWLTVNYFRTKATPSTEDDLLNKSSNRIYRTILRMLGGPFWATIVFVEVMDLAFSIDNVFAAVAFTNNLYLIWTGVFLGILSMRFVAQGFVKLIERFSFLESISFFVIGLLGLKLIVSYTSEYFKDSLLYVFMHSEEADLYVSLFTVLIFVVPIVTSQLLNFPRQTGAKPKESEAVNANKTVYL
jgi:YkoY family integral membrane protein